MQDQSEQNCELTKKRRDFKVEPVEANDPFRTLDHVAGQLLIDRKTAKKLFIREKGVVLIGRATKGGKRGYQTMRIPQSVVNRVLANLAVNA